MGLLCLCETQYTIDSLINSLDINCRLHIIKAIIKLKKHFTEGKLRSQLNTGIRGR